MAQDPIKHVVVLMLENRSFDHMLGDVPKMRARFPLNGSNADGGRVVTQAPGAARRLVNDPAHDTTDVLLQLGITGTAGLNGGFLQNYAHAFHDWPGGSTPDEIMKYHAAGTLPALHGLAEAFTICDHWFSPVPGPTWTNRLFALSGTSLGRVNMPNGLLHLDLHWYEQPTVFDRLNERDISWKVYYGDVPLSFLFVHQWEPQNVARHRKMTEFFKDAAGEADKFPAFAFIEPAYLQPGANDAHPPHDILEADLLVADVYDAIRANEALWESTLLVVLCDEHGGFYDHVPAPAALPPDHHRDEYTFDHYGARVPAVLISPYLANGVFDQPMDHTSLLNYLQGKWQLGALGARTAAAKNFAGQILTKPRKDTPPVAPRPAQAASPTVSSPTVSPPAISSVTGSVPSGTLSDHQTAIVALSHLLESMAGEDPTVVAARNHQVLTGAQSQIDAATDRVESFIAARSRLG